MSNSNKQDSIGDDSSNSEGFDNPTSSVADFTGDDDMSVGITERLTEILIEESDGDLMLSQSERGVWVLQWIHALDTQVMGACRVDERLKPLLKLSVSSGAAEDRLLAHLSQHFEPSEVGILARCLCIPLISIRVGKNIKQGNLLCPTAIRGSLNLMLLPTSVLRMSFIGDDGHTERLVTVSSSLQCSAAVIEEIPADNSGRSFLVKIPDHEVLYFWCSEKSKILGIELLAKMKDLLTRKPSLSELTGICESRLDCFAAHLRANLGGSAVSKTKTSSTGSSSSSLFSALDFCEVSHNAQCMLPCKKPMQFQQNQSMKSNSFYQSRLSPRLSSFKEVSLKSAVREKLKRRSDNPTPLDDSTTSFVTKEESTSDHFRKGTKPEISETCTLPPSTFLESLDKSAGLASFNPVSLVTPLGTSLLSPCYCWCPMTPPDVPFSSESLSLPSLSTFLPSTRSASLLTSSSALSISNVTSLGLPAFFTDPLVRLPFLMPNSTQIPTFTSLMCDPIIHIPVINVCSSGQGYLVSAGPAMSTSIQPIHPNLVSPLRPNTDSLIENGARETLRLLINSTNQSNPQLMDVLLPEFVTTNRDESNQNIVQTGSCGIYVGSSDADAITNSFAAFRLVSSHSMGFAEESVSMRCSDKDDLDLRTVSSSGLDEFCSDVVSNSSKSMEKNID